ncbi:hypothetical protein LSTR_LSTR004478 [Laodelphax striatellus]|uniref:Uncharacterized protein n=1 Tax=Laodelphax striatellus TaxID=195883 RepID=A0A482XNV7_LAOST|nr:hypothetical protein LSTR_LSTR004478 [Laodelphax striatellus]
MCLVKELRNPERHQVSGGEGNCSTRRDNSEKLVQGGGVDAIGSAVALAVARGGHSVPPASPPPPQCSSRSCQGHLQGQRHLQGHAILLQGQGNRFQEHLLQGHGHLIQGHLQGQGRLVQGQVGGMSHADTGGSFTLEAVTQADVDQVTLILNIANDGVVGVACQPDTLLGDHIVCSWRYKPQLCPPPPSTPLVRGNLGDFGLWQSSNLGLWDQRRSPNCPVTLIAELSGLQPFTPTTLKGGKECQRSFQTFGIAVILCSEIRSQIAS